MVVGFEGFTSFTLDHCSVAIPIKDERRNKVKQSKFSRNLRQMLNIKIHYVFLISEMK